jgi:hypothetical protein
MASPTRPVFRTGILCSNKTAFETKRGGYCSNRAECNPASPIAGFCRAGCKADVTRFLGADIVSDFQVEFRFLIGNNRIGAIKTLRNCILREIHDTYVDAKRRELERIAQDIDDYIQGYMNVYDVTQACTPTLIADPQTTIITPASALQLALVALRRTRLPPCK